ncbi:MAG: septum formation initiator family protein [Cellvibrionales bacterium]|nr:septum formation initiator family protein [Cellvibrionales bacterium]
MKWLNISLILILLLLQAKLWFGEGSVVEMLNTQQKMAVQIQANEAAIIRNEKLTQQVLSLQQGDKGVEAYARRELGLIKPDETFFFFVNDEN